MQTTRRQMLELLAEAEQSAKDLSQKLRIREKEVHEHLTHIKQSAAAQKKKLTVTPAQCLECGYLFESRNRFTSPGRCPRCKGEHITDPKYRIT
jgi:predicted Zn-ribbon and HTH transcriptional regulator